MKTDGVRRRRHGVRVGGFGILLSLILGFAWGCGRHPGDARLVDFYSANEATLTNLLSSLRKDSAIDRLTWRGGTLAVDSGGASARIEVERYESLLARLGRDVTIVSHGGGKQVYFFLSTRGIAVSGSAKGLVYQEAAPDRIVVDTDASARTNGPFTVFRRIGSNWYVFYSR